MSLLLLSWLSLSFCFSFIVVRILVTTAHRLKCLISRFMFLFSYSLQKVTVVVVVVVVVAVVVVVVVVVVVCVAAN